MKCRYCGCAIVGPYSSDDAACAPCLEVERAALVERVAELERALNEATPYKRYCDEYVAQLNGLYGELSAQALVTRKALERAQRAELVLFKYGQSARSIHQQAAEILEILARPAQGEVSDEE